MLNQFLFLLMSIVDTLNFVSQHLLTLHLKQDFVSLLGNHFFVTVNLFALDGVDCSPGSHGSLATRHLYSLPSHCFRDGHAALPEAIVHTEAFMGMLVEKHSLLCIGFDLRGFALEKRGAAMTKWSLG